jgi:hypothetical protein
MAPLLRRSGGIACQTLLTLLVFLGLAYTGAQQILACCPPTEACALRQPMLEWRQREEGVTGVAPPLTPFRLAFLI